MRKFHYMKEKNTDKFYFKISVFLIYIPEVPRVSLDVTC